MTSTGAALPVSSELYFSKRIQCTAERRRREGRALLLEEIERNVPTSGGVPVVLDGVVSSSGQHLGDLRPLVTVDTMCSSQYVFFVLRPRLLTYRRVELIVPPRKPER